MPPTGASSQAGKCAATHLLKSHTRKQQPRQCVGITAASPGGGTTDGCWQPSRHARSSSVPIRCWAEMASTGRCVRLRNARNVAPSPRPSDHLSTLLATTSAGRVSSAGEKSRNSSCQKCTCACNRSHRKFDALLLRLQHAQRGAPPVPVRPLTHLPGQDKRRALKQHWRNICSSSSQHRTCVFPL